MLRPILFVLLITLAKLHSGDGVGDRPWDRKYSSLPSRRFSFPSSSPSPPSPEPTAPQRQLSSQRSGRYGTGISQQPSPSLTRSGSFKEASLPKQLTPSPSRRFGAPNRQDNGDLQQGFPPGLFGGDFSEPGGPDDSMLPAGRPKQIMIKVDQYGRPIGDIPPGYSLQTSPNGAPQTINITDYLENEKRREEEEDPDSHKINTKGEVIEQQLPKGGGDIAIKISGTNITQRKMNKLRELMQTSIDIVFQNPEFKTGLMARSM